MVLYFTPFEDSKSAWLCVLTVQKVFSALEVPQRSFLTSAEEKNWKRGLVSQAAALCQKLWAL